MNEEVGPDHTDVLQIGDGDRPPNRVSTRSGRSRRWLVGIVVGLLVLAGIGSGARSSWDRSHTYTADDLLTAARELTGQKSLQGVQTVTNVHALGPPRTVTPAECDALFVPGAGAVDGFTSIVVTGSPDGGSGRDATMPGLWRFDSPASARAGRRRLAQTLDGCDGVVARPQDTSDGYARASYRITALARSGFGSTLRWELGYRYDGKDQGSATYVVRTHGNVVMTAAQNRPATDTSQAVADGWLDHASERLDQSAASR